MAVAIADALQISVGELAGVPSHRVNLSGSWWTAWQTFKDGRELVAVQEVRFRQQADLVQVETLMRGRDVADGGYHWRGELRLWDNEILMGWYVANDGSVRAKGTMYFVLHQHGINMTGRWVGLSYDGLIVTGWGAIGRSDHEARKLVEELSIGIGPAEKPL